MIKYQWEIFRADLDPVKGSEQAGTRPVLVISTEEANLALPVVTIMSITSMKTGRKVYPIEVLLSAKETGLTVDSIAMAHQIRVISKERIKERCGSIESPELRESIRSVLRTYLDL